MTNALNKHDPAFACASAEGHQRGITVREYFAAMAMQAFCGVMGPIQTDPKRCAEQAVIHADALIEAINKE